MIDIELLDGRVKVTNESGSVPLLGDDPWLIAALALAGEDGLAARTIMQALSGSTKADTLRKRFERFHDRTGLITTSEDVKSFKIYRLDMTDVRVDALHYLEGVDKIRRAGSEAEHAVIESTRKLWKAGLPQFTGLPNPAGPAYDRLTVAHQYLEHRSRRILIVDDQVGDLLAQRLDRSRCHVAHDFDEFERCRPELDLFDLAVVDLHLTSSYADATGDTVVREINSMGVGLPVVMITLRPPENRSVPEWIKSLGLVDVIFKAADGPGADMAYVAQRVNDLLREGPTARACDQLAQRVPTLRRKARQRLQATHSGADVQDMVERMDREADQIGRFAAENHLARARTHMERFTITYGE